MKNKIMLAAMAIVCAFCCVFGLVACNNTTETPSHSHNYQWVDNGNGTHKQHCANGGCDAPDINSESHTWGANDTCTKCPAVKSAEGHSHNYQWIDNGDGTHKQHCANSGCDTPDINSGTHVWGANDKCTSCPAVKPAEGHTHNYQWVDNGDGTHKQHCANSGCNAPDINSGSHVWGANDKCMSCSAVKPATDHTHDYKWVNNWDGTHKQHCANDGCDAPDISQGEHTYVKESFSSRCDKCGDFEAPEGHTHDYQWKDDGSGNHSLVCQNEGCNYPNPSFATTEEHTWGENGICDKCHAVSLQLHKHTVSARYYCQGDVNHFQKCDSCNLAVSFGEHKYPSDGAACSLCGHKKTTTSMNLTFELNEDGKSYSITKFKDTFGNVANVVIPCEHFGRPVTSISEDAFKNSNITSVEILDCCIDGCGLTSGVTSIESGAFEGCTKLKNAVIPSTVTEIAFGAFNGCSSLSEITLPFVGRSADAHDNDANLGYIFGSNGYANNPSFVPSTLKTVVVIGGTAIAHHAFGYCQVENITLPDGLTTIGEWAFSNGNITSINIPSTVTSIGESAFKYAGITSIVLPNVQTIEASTFERCNQLAEVSLGSRLTSIADNAFKNCDKLKTVYYAGDLTGWCNLDGLGELMSSSPALYIDRQLLSGELVIPSTVTKIGSDAFRGCSEITSVLIHGGVTNINFTAFIDCTKLKSITVDSSNATYFSQDGILYSRSNEETYCLVVPAALEGEITVPEGVVQISVSGQNVTAICLPSGIERISISNCNITTITLPESVTFVSIVKCTHLERIIYEGTPEQWQSVQKDLDKNNGAEPPVTCLGQNPAVPHSHDYQWVDNDDGTHKQHCANSGCGEPDINEGEHVFVDNMCICDTSELLFELNSDRSSYFVKHIGYMGATEIVIPSEHYGLPVTKIAEDAFANQTSLTSVTISDGITEIGRYAFLGCYSLTDVSIPSSVTVIGEHAFTYYDESCPIERIAMPVFVIDHINPQNLTEITIIGGESIESSFFNEIENLTSLSLGDSVISTNITPLKNMANFASLSLGKNVTNIDTATLRNIASFASITVDENNPNYTVQEGILYNKDITEILLTPRQLSGTVTIPSTITEISSSAFYGCKLLTKIIIHDDITSIGANAFQNCSGLTEINIPDGVTSIGDYAFRGCAGLTEIKIPTVVTSIGIGAFLACSRLESIEIPEGITTIANSTFSDCTKLASVKLPEGITSIGNNAFQSCVLTNFELPSTLETIGNQAFRGSKISSIVIPEGVTSIGIGAFQYSYLTSIELPSTVTSISESMFASCASLTTVKIASTVTKIDAKAFQYCSELTSIIFEGTSEQWEAITKGTDWDNGTGEYTVTCTGDEN